MHDPDLIWRLGRWIARRESGTARLSWSEGVLELLLRRGIAISLKGPDPASLAERLGCEPSGRDDVLEEARELAAQRGIPESQTVGAAKELLQDGLRSWFEDPNRGLELVEGEVEDRELPTISISHAIIELILADTGTDFVSLILPDNHLVLRRSPNFLELYSPLRLSEEADLVVAKITGQRTADEISSRSPHSTDEVIRLLAALTATGMLEPIPVAEQDERRDLLTVDLPEDEPTRRQLPVRWIGVGVVLLAVMLIVLAIVFLRPSQAPPDAGATIFWGVVVDMGCEPQELQRVLKKARQNPNDLRPMQADTGDGDPCWRLVWGRFPSREAAVDEVANIPERLLFEGFQPHPVELPSSQPEGDSD
jgi:hypothetical protein